MKKPNKIYKYESFSSQSLKNLKAQSFYFGSPLGFNDPYDCALKAGIENPSKSEVSQFRQHYLEETKDFAEAHEEFKAKTDKELIQIIINSTKTVLEENTQNFLKNRGVTCFSETENDLLMWSHYGGAYKGFCLEFDTSFEPFSKLKKVVYSEDMPKVNAVSLLLNQDYDHITNLYCTKSDSWKYEKEWRIIHHNAGTLFTYKAPSLTSIFFGPDIDTQSLEIICLILSGQNPNVKLWKGRRSKEKFEVNFEEFSYTNFVDSMKNT